MTDVSFFDLVVRMVVSLGIVLGLMFGAYWFLRQRQGFTPSAGMRRGPRAPGSRSLRSLFGAPGGSRAPRGAVRGGGSGRVTGNRRGLRVVGRVGVGRATQVVAVQFADRVYLLGASETSAPTVLADLDLAAWTAATETADDEMQTLLRDTGDLRVARTTTPGSTNPPRTTSLLDSLREATTRRG